MNRGQTGPFLVLIGGGTASGKSTIASAVAERTGALHLCHDRYYKDVAQPVGHNYDHPDALETELLVEHLDRLRAGEPIDVPVYDFKVHQRAPESRRVIPTPVVLVEGILVFVEPPLRERLDIKIFVDTDADIRIFRRIRRDMEHRGRTFESIREQYYRTVRPMHLQFVEPSKRWADLIIPEGGNNKVALDLIIAKLESVLARAAKGDAG